MKKIISFIKDIKFNTKIYEISSISLEHNLAIDDVVVTSGLGGKEPRGIFVGVVKDIKNDKYNLSKTLYLETGQDFDSIHYLTVLKEKK